GRVPQIGNDGGADVFEAQSDADGRVNGGTCCLDGSACNAVDPVCAFCGTTQAPCLADVDCPVGDTCFGGADDLDRGFCSDGFAESAGLFFLGGPCVGDVTDVCSNFVAKVMAPAKTTITLQPVPEPFTGALDPGASINGNEITLVSGGKVWLEAKIGNWDPDGLGTQLKAYQVSIDSTGYTSGLQGTLTPRLEPCVTDADCAAVFGGACTLTGAQCLQDADCPLPGFGETCSGPPCESGLQGSFCTPGFILKGRSDFVFAGLEEVSAVNLTTLDYVFGTVATPEFADAAPPFPKYGGTVVLDVAQDAAGVFTIRMRDIPATLLIDGNNIDLPLVGLIPARINKRLCGLPPVADCNNNGIADACDVEDGTSEDCNGNTVPDECERAACTPMSPSFPGCDDCNLIGGLDECDIASGLSLDTNSDGVPDECVNQAGGTTTFNDPNGWDGLSVPGPGDAATVDGADADVTVDGDASLLALRLLDGATIEVTGELVGDLTVGSGGVFDEGNFLVAGPRLVDVSAGPFVVGRGGKYLAAPAAATSQSGPPPRVQTSAELRAGSLILLPTVCPSSEQMTLESFMTANVAGDLIMDGRNVQLCPVGD
ncbi:MAG: hypothetical protein ACE5EX_11650, partial [Phycisphaerae bacterium]